MLDLYDSIVKVLEIIMEDGTVIDSKTKASRLLEAIVDLTLF